MSEWNDQPRLSAELEEYANRANVNSDHRSQLRAKLSAQIDRPNQAEPDKPRHRGTKLVLAAAVVTIIGVAVAQLTPGSNTTVAVDTPPTASTSESPATSGPNLDQMEELDRNSFCRAHPTNGTIRWVVANPDSTSGSTTEVRVEFAEPASAFTGPVFVVLEGRPSIDGGLGLFGGQPEGASVVMTVPDLESPTQAQAVGSTILESLCSTASYLVADSEMLSHAESIACAPEQTRRPSGLVIIDPGRALTYCETMPPVLVLIDDQTDEQLEEWADSFNCSGSAAAEELPGGVKKISFGDCETTLTFLDTSDLGESDIGEAAVRHALDLR